MPKYLKFITFIMVVFTLTGCLGTPSISVSISPDPLVFKFGESSKEVTFKFRTQGFGNLELDSLSLQLVDDNDEVIWDDEVLLDEDTFVIPGVTHEETESVSLPADLQYATEEMYDAELKGKTYTLMVIITGSKEVTTTADVVFQ